MGAPEDLFEAIKGRNAKRVEELLSPSKFLWWTFPPRADPSERFASGQLPIIQALKSYQDYELCAHESPKFAEWKKRSLDVINVLVAKGADLNAVNREGHTPLVAAVKACSPGSVKLLLARGAAVDPEKNGKSQAIAHAWHGANKRWIPLDLPNFDEVERISKNRYREILDILNRAT